MIGEDLEGFWERNEAEGGARLLMGPSVRFAPPSGHWQVSAAGGPIVYASRNSNTSDAARTVPAASSRDSFGFKTSLSYHF